MTTYLLTIFTFGRMLCISITIELQLFKNSMCTELFFSLCIPEEVTFTSTEGLSGIFLEKKATVDWYNGLLVDVHHLSQHTEIC